MKKRNSNNPFFSSKNSINQSVFTQDAYHIVMKREDLIDTVVSGNKFRKLKYNITAAIKQEYLGLLSFGGAFSNHLAAVAATGNHLGWPTVGIVRGLEWENRWQESPTLSYCKARGMELRFVSRTAYRNKTNAGWLHTHFGNAKQYYVLPEGGTNAAAVKGCKEILTAEDAGFDTICCSVGTGGTMAGLIESATDRQRVLGFPALNNPKLADEIRKFTTKKNWQLIPDYTFGGYAKVKPELIRFINQYYNAHQIPLDPIYTGKLVFGIFDLIKQRKWPGGKNILIIHTGGLQGVDGMNQWLQKKGVPRIQFSSAAS